MRILVLGGTHFVGRHIVEALLSAGHSVTVFNRGRSRDELPARVGRLRGDRNDGQFGLYALTARNWDACVDVSGYTARHVGASAEKLRASVGHYVFVSAVSVYGDPRSGPVYETEPRVAPAGEDVIDVTRETYGPLKVACENIVRESFGKRCALLRPQIVAGPHDPFDRFSYWAARTTRAGEVMAPGDGSDHVQFIDAGDLARFTRIVCEERISGSFNLAGPRLTWANFMETLGARNLVWVSRDVFTTAGVTEFEIPLYRPAGGPRSSLMHVSNAKAVSAGLTLTDPAITATRVRAWLNGREQSAALSPEREAALIEASRAR